MKKILILFYVTIVVLLSSVDSLSNYCSNNINTAQLYSNFENCIDINNYGKYPVKMKMSDYIVFNETYKNITSILKRVFISIEGDAMTSKNDTKHLFMDLLRLVKLTKSDSKTQFCFTTICDFFKNCEFPVDIEYKLFESDALVAARFASILSAYTFNEELEKQVYLSKANVFSLLRSITENDNIYDCKITSLRTPEQERFMFHATKDIDLKTIEVKNFNMIMENTKKLPMVL